MHFFIHGSIHLFFMSNLIKTIGRRVVCVLDVFRDILNAPLHDNFVCLFNFNPRGRGSPLTKLTTLKTKGLPLELCKFSDELYTNSQGMDTDPILIVDNRQQVYTLHKTNRL